MTKEYLTLKYNSRVRWLSYWYQISETLDSSPDNVLIIGKGSGITENSINILSENRIKIVTIDINDAVNPDVAGDVISLPFRDNSFDAAICCQVLEHIPFDRFPAALSEISRVAKKRIILSVPHKRKHLKLAVSIPFLGDKQLIIKSPLTKRYCSSKQHFWEIGRGVSRKEALK
ncbi:MAG: class I SAM-dependent methyltransferase [Nitrospirota bacterium]|nr:class I SAM-dependent methyltransferase [Nitrospirota bacterium]